MPEPPAPSSNAQATTDGSTEAGQQQQQQQKREQDVTVQQATPQQGGEQQQQQQQGEGVAITEPADAEGGCAQGTDSSQSHAASEQQLQGGLETAGAEEAAAGVVPADAPQPIAESADGMMITSACGPVDSMHAVCPALKVLPQLPLPHLLHLELDSCRCELDDVTLLFTLKRSTCRLHTSAVHSGRAATHFCSFLLL